MNLNSNPVSKLLKAEATNTDTHNSIIKEHITGSSFNRFEVSRNSDVVGDTFVNVFTDDILPEILDNIRILNAYDLLNFRQVNRCWRDAATSVLLKRNLCEISVTFGKANLEENVVDPVAQVQDGENYASKMKSHKYFNANQPKSFLADLSALIYTSPKFPCNSIYFDEKCSLGFGNLRPPSETADEYQKDLFHFFSLYGKKVRQLTFSNGISRKAVKNLLFVHMPHLICLDLLQFTDFFDFFDDDENEEVKKDDLLVPRPALELRKIALGLEPEMLDDKSDLLKELVDASPNLCTFQSVGVSSIRCLLKMGKCHLIENLMLFCPGLHQLLDLKKFSKLVTNTKIQNRPKLSNLTIMFTNIWRNVDMLDAFKYFNIILSASKDSLKYLELILDQSVANVNIFIPPLPHLQYLRLGDYLSSVVPKIHFLGDVIGRGIQAGKLTVDQPAPDFNSLASQNNQVNCNIPQDYFPRLQKVSLHRSFRVMGEMKNEPQKLMNFFSLEHTTGPERETNCPGDTLLTVTKLKLNLILPDEIRNMSTLFPNVSQLKMTIACSNNLGKCIWTAFPKLSTLEIHVLHSYYLEQDNNDGNSKMLDSFFTGFSSELCTKLESDETGTELQGLRRTQPYLADCKYLKEFKISFPSGQSCKFVSKVTALYGFQDVFHRTRIIFCFASISEGQIAETLQNLEPVAEYVEIQIKKITHATNRCIGCTR